MCYLLTHKSAKPKYNNFPVNKVKRHLWRKQPQIIVISHSSH